MYMISARQAESTAFDTEEIAAHNGLLAVSLEEWEEVRKEIPHMDVAQVLADREKAFLHAESDER